MTLGHILRRYGGAFLRQIPASSRFVGRTLQSLATCRTPVLGGHVTRCTGCGDVQYRYHSCGNRHCPQCGGNKRAEWLDRRQADLLPVPYFHVVFTLPHELSALALGNRRELYSILFEAARETLLEVAADPKHLGARIGILMVLHTWGQQLEHHPHVHCVVPGGGVSLDGQRWVACRSPRWLLPVRVLSKVFRGKYLFKLCALYDQGQLRLAGSTSPLAEAKDFAEFIRGLYRKKWVVYAKKPFGGPEQVLKYLANYTHRVALSNRRLVKLENDAVTFTWKDYTDNCRRKELTLAAVEFVRRFSLHVLPKGLMRIRQYGLLSQRDRGKRLARCRELLGVAGAVEVGAAGRDMAMSAPAPPAATESAAPAVEPDPFWMRNLLRSVLGLLLLGGSAATEESSRLIGVLMLADLLTVVPGEERCGCCGGRLEVIGRMDRPTGKQLEARWRWDSS